MTETLLNNRYQITDSLGKGGFGETFLAIDTHMPSARKCAIKKLKPAIKTPQIPQWLQERFQREAAILEKLGEDCAQIPKLYAYFCEAGNFYLVQECIEGITLRQKYQQQGNFSASQVRDLLIKLLPVLDYIHQRRIIHRDIKPDNIIWRTTDNQPVLIDFGVVKEAVATAIQVEGNTAYSIVLGTPGYMASEQAAGRPAYSSDLFSLGLTAVFLLTGKTPQYLSTDSNTGELLWREDLPDLDRKLATVIDRAIRFHPRDRFATAKEMLAALRENESVGGSLADRHRLTGTMTSVVRTTPVKTYPQKQSTAKQLRSQVDPVSSQPEIRWLQWSLGLLLFTGVTAAAFAIGFYAFSLRQTSEPAEVQPVIPDIQTFPPIPSSAPTTPTPEATVSPSPSPEATTSPSPSPSPEATISPSPSPSPEATTSPSPSPETTVNPSPNPSPEATTSPNPSPETTVSPSPNPNPETTVSPNPSPSPEATTSPGSEVETDFPKNSATPLEESKTQSDENTASPMPTPNIEN
jgi:serine/threonine protein kinase, bacterial